MKRIHPVVQLAKDTVESYIRTGTIIHSTVSDPVMAEKAGVFVSLKKKGVLRGCIGTFLPSRDSVAEEIVANAVQSATEDPRFPPVRTNELEHLEYSVDILTFPQPVKSVNELDPKKYGIVVECDYRRGLLLPDLEGVDTVEQQIAICRAKAGIADNEPVKLYRFEVRRFT